MFMITSDAKVTATSEFKPEKLPALGRPIQLILKVCKSIFLVAKPFLILQTINMDYKKSVFGQTFRAGVREMT
jgi:hypothetical protein